MRIKTKKIYDGRVVRLSLETVELPNGFHAELEVIDHPGGVAILALNARKEICLLHQYRYAAGGHIWELPAGTIDPGETPDRTAVRELEEEAGTIASSWSKLGEIMTSPGVFKERMHLYLAEDLTVGPTQHGEDEVISVHWLPAQQVLQWADDGTIIDAKTLIGINYWRSAGPAL